MKSFLRALSSVVNAEARGKTILEHFEEEIEFAARRKPKEPRCTQLEEGWINSGRFYFRICPFLATIAGTGAEFQNMIWASSCVKNPADQRLLALATLYHIAPAIFLAKGTFLAEYCSLTEDLHKLWESARGGDRNSRQMLKDFFKANNGYEDVFFEPSGVSWPFLLPVLHDLKASEIPGAIKACEESTREYLRSPFRANAV